VTDGHGGRQPPFAWSSATAKHRSRRSPKTDCKRNLGRHRQKPTHETLQGIDQDLLTDSLDQLVNTCDIVVECWGNVRRAADVVERALLAGRPVVTMNTEFHKGFLNHHPSEDEMAYWANRNGISLEQTISFTDGTKLQMEQVLVANGLGATLARRGMIGAQIEPLAIAGAHQNPAPHRLQAAPQQLLPTGGHRGHCGQARPRARALDAARGRRLRRAR
jgi:hypothetical protein